MYAAQLTRCRRTRGFSKHSSRRHVQRNCASRDPVVYNSFQKLCSQPFPNVRFDRNKNRSGSRSILPVANLFLVASSAHSIGVIRYGYRRLSNDFALCKLSRRPVRFVIPFNPGLPVPIPPSVSVCTISFVILSARFRVSQPYYTGGTAAPELYFEGVAMGFISPPAPTHSIDIRFSIKYMPLNIRSG